MIGTLALLISWIPLFNFAVVPIVVVGGFLSVFGVLVSALNGKSGTGWPLMGVMLNVGAALVMVSTNALAIGFLLQEGREKERVVPVEEVRREGPAPAPRAGKKVRVAPARKAEPVVPREPLRPIVVNQFVVEEPEKTGIVKAPERLSEAIDRGATIFRMGMNLERAGKSKAALENYRRVVKEFGDTPSAVPASERITALENK